jgi:exopolysaccharide production protein ExoZ
MKLIHIQIVRVLAATSVVLFHCLATGQNYFDVPDRISVAVLAYGGFGVDLFFVVSGFIIYYSTLHREQRAGPFLRRRLERIVPIYWIFTAAFLAVAVAAPGVVRSTEMLDPRLIGSSLFYVSFLMGRMPILYVGWSLEYEMLFYLAVSALLCFGRPPAWDRLVVCFCGLILIGLAGHPVTKGSAGAMAFDFFTSPLLLEFVLGVVAARYALQGGLPWRPTLMAVATFAAVALFAAAEMRDRVAIVGSGAAVLVVLAARADRATAAPGRVRTTLAALGDASYAIYLIQIFTVSAACKVLKALDPDLPFEAVALVSTAVTLAAGYGAFVLIERPLLRLCRGAGLESATNSVSRGRLAHERRAPHPADEPGGVPRLGRSPERAV